MGMNNTGYACCEICGAELRLLTIFSRDRQEPCKARKRRHELAFVETYPRKCRYGA